MGRVKWREFRDVIEGMSNAIEESYHVPVTLDYSRRTSGSVPSVDGEDGTGYVRLGMKDLQFAKLRRYVPERDFVRVVLSLYHEERHLQQGRCDFIGLDDDIDAELACRMAKYHLTGWAVPEFYHATKMKSPLEHDAELYALKETRKFFHLNGRRIPPPL